jgi:hypothetical protein
VFLVSPVTITFPLKSVESKLVPVIVASVASVVDHTTRAVVEVSVVAVIVIVGDGKSVLASAVTVSGFDALASLEHTKV